MVIMKSKKSFDENSQIKKQIPDNTKEADLLMEQVELLADIIVSLLLTEKNNKNENRPET